MLSNVWYYVFYSSAIFIYGIGINRAILVSKKPKNILVDFVKMVISVTSSAVLTYLVSEKLLGNIGLMDIYPFIAVLIFSSISVFIEAIVRIASRTGVAEYTVSILCILIAVNESVTLVECLVNSCLCIASYFLSIPVLFSLRKRIELSHPSEDFHNLSLLFISIAIVILVFLTWNVSWLNPGAF